MPPKPSSDRAAKKPSGRMIQPALPILPGRPGAKANKKQSIPPQETPKIGERSPEHTVATHNPGAIENDTTGDTPQLTGAPEDVSHTEKPSASTSSPAIASEPASPPPPPQAPTSVQGDEVDVDEKQTAVADNSETVANTMVEVSTLAALETSSSPANSERTHDQAVAPDMAPTEFNVPGPRRHSSSFGSSSVTMGEDTRRVLSGPGPAVATTPPASMPPSHEVVNGNQPFMTTPPGGSAAAGPQAHTEYEAAQASQASVSSASPFDQSANGFPPQMAAFTPSQRTPVPVPRQFNPLVPLIDHLISIAATKEGSDWALQINSPDGQPFVTFGHSVILNRSLRLRKLMDRQKSNTYAVHMINLFPARPIVPHAFEAALRFLYSDTVLSDNFFANILPGPDYHATRLQNLDYILSYWVSGIELGLEPVSVCAERLLVSVLKWDILEATYKHAIELANSPMSQVGKNMTGTDYLIASNAVVRLVLSYLAKNIDVEKFQLDRHSPSNVFPPRLPPLDEGRPRFNPALASMVFGSMPSSSSSFDFTPSPGPDSEPMNQGRNPAFADTVASNILLNVDFENLNLFNELIRQRAGAAGVQIMAAIVEEREQRRLKCFHAEHIGNAERMARSTLWEPVGLKESLNGIVLSREHVGFLLPSNKPPGSSSMRSDSTSTGTA
ncbi:hypothetical protein ABEF93_002483 [Exophiala dermatitidis]